jgi:YHS domain-containing protein
MIKRIFWVSPALIAGAIGLTHLLHGVSEAGTYNLEYPANYGCKCTPNVLHYGYFKTEWRQAPGEVRPNQKVIGAELLQPVKGYEQLPLPRVKLQDLQPPPESGNPSPTPNGQPSPSPGLPPDPNNPGGPAGPGGDNLSNPKSEPGGFNPTPGLNLDQNPPGALGEPEKKPIEPPKDTPSPLEKNEKPAVEPPKDLKDSAKPAVGGLNFKPELPKKGVFNQPILNRNVEMGGLKSSVPTRLPDTATAKPAAADSQTLNQAHPQANWNSALEPGMYPESFRSGTIYPATDMARQADYQAPVQSSGSGRLSSGVVEQSFQQPQPSAGKSAPPLALKGYCPVELCRNGRWVQGDPRWTVIHQGVTYRLSGNEQRLQFLANPEQFAPANGGNDLVISVNQRRNVPGELSYCAAFKGRIYMFSSSATQLEFQKNPERFIGVQNQNAESSSSGAGSLGVRDSQTLGRSYNQQREGF